MKELAKSEQWTADGGKFVPGLTKWILGESWRRVPVILTTEEARSAFEREIGYLPVMERGPYNSVTAQWEDDRPNSQVASYRQQFEICVEANDLAGCLVITQSMKERREKIERSL